MTKIINGKEFSKKIIEEIKAKISKLEKKPSLAVILANNDCASSIYVKNKEKTALEIGFNSHIYRFEENVKQEEILKLIERLNNDITVNGILVQLPLFSHLNEEEIIEKISPIKDVDGFHPINVGKLNCGLEPYAIPCTPKGIIKLLKENNIDLTGKNALVIGRSNIVGKPIANLLLKENATVTIAHSKTKNLKSITKQADIIISATGSPKLIKKDMIKDDVILIDVGITRQENKKLCGDIDFENVFDKASYITPVPGGVGPMTIACLMENTFELYLKQNKKEG